MQESIRSYYYQMGWDPETGVPTKITLERLNLDWAVGLLAEIGQQA